MMMRTIDKLDKIGADKVRAILVDDCGVTGEKADEILRFIAIPARARTGPRLPRGLPRPERAFDPASTSCHRRGIPGGVRRPGGELRVDLTIARGLDYYTGTVYETALLDHPEIGSICSGGRYDNLAEYYTDSKLPGVGISIGLTRLFYVLGEQGFLNDAAQHRARGRAASCR